MIWLQPCYRKKFWCQMKTWRKNAKQEHEEKMQSKKVKIGCMVPIKDVEYVCWCGMYAVLEQAMNDA